MSIWNKIIVFLGCLSFSVLINAQEYKNYTIKYEKRINLQNLYPKNNYFNNNSNKFFKDYFILTANETNSSYIHLENEINQKSNFIGLYNTYSDTYLDFVSDSVISIKEIGEMTIREEDTILKLQWKFINETREIAGYTCYKAYAKYDSLEFVAYFCPQLISPTGPESITGLPGTILGLVIPKIHHTWLAQEIKILDSDALKDSKIPKKGKPINRQNLKKLLLESFKDYQNYNLLVQFIII